MDVLAVNLVGLGLIGLIVWYFWLAKPEGVAAGITADGVQEAFIVVKGGYSPKVVRVTAGRPVRLVFNRQESDPCSERVMLSAFGLSTELPQGHNVSVEFKPNKPGQFEFTCQMGMLRGKVVAS